MMILDNLQRAYPEAVTRAFSEDDHKRLQEYQALALLPADARAERFDTMADPARRKIWKEMEAEGLEYARTRWDTDYVVRGFSEWVFGVVPTSLPGGPLDSITSRAMMGEFQTLFADRFAAFNGNISQAKAAAFELMRRKWGVTEIGHTAVDTDFSLNPIDLGTRVVGAVQGQARIMPYPPEMFFPQVDGSHTYLDEQLDALVESEFPGAQSWAPLALDFTEGAVGVGAQPSWAISIIDGNGVYRVLQPGPEAPPGWPFNYETARDAARERFEELRSDIEQSEAEIDAAKQAHPELAPPASIMEEFQERLRDAQDGIGGSGPTLP